MNDFCSTELQKINTKQVNAQMKIEISEVETTWNMVSS